MDEPPQPLIDWFEPHPDERLVMVERISIVEDVLTQVRTVYLRVREAQVPSALEDDYKGDFYAVMRRLGIVVDNAELYLSPEVADVRVAEILGVPVGFPLMLFENHSYDATGRLTYLSYGRTRGDFVGLVLHKRDQS